MSCFGCSPSSARSLVGPMDDDLVERDVDVRRDERVVNGTAHLALGCDEVGCLDRVAAVEVQ